MSLLNRLSSTGPKRILALDGGGIRGLMTICFLERLENVLRDRYKDTGFRLCDYFDLIGGTSTGAIIAGALATGMDVASVKKLYLDLGPRIFGRKKTKLWEAMFDEKPLEQALQEHFGDITMGDARILTGLCLVTKRADTNSTWPMLNHPGGKYFKKNESILLRQAVRASAAAPLFFVPVKLEVAPGQQATFVDGGISMANNPALLLFMVATLRGFPFHWKTGADKLLLVSMGTGAWQWNFDAVKMSKDKMWDWLGHLPKMFIQDADWQNQSVLQYISRTLTPWEIDRESGDLSGDSLLPEPALTYVRYNVRLEEAWLRELGLNFTAGQIAGLRKLGGSRVEKEHVETGDAAARAQVKAAHLPPDFDVR